jgi:hypothetical protein
MFHTKTEKTIFCATITLFVIISLCIIFVYKNMKYFVEIIAKISPIFIIGTLMIGINQIKLNQEQQKNTKEWNKKQLAITQIHKSRYKLSKILRALDKIFKNKNIKSITDRQPYETFTLKEIHTLMGNGEYSPNGKFEFDCEDGEKTRRLLLNFLGEYEYIAAATNLEIFDKKVVKDILSYNIIRTYCIFRTYIKHIREIHTGDNYIYIEIEKLALSFCKEKEKECCKRNS